MKMRHLVCSMLLVGSPILAANTSKFSACSNGIDGLPITDFSGISCHIQSELQEWQGESLAKLSQELISTLRLEAKLHWPTASTMEQQESSLLHIKLPPQSVQIDAELIQGPPLKLELSIAPSLSIRGNSVCQFKLESLQLNISSLESSLESWLNKSLMEGINRDTAVKNTLQALVENELTTLQQEVCSVASYPKPARIDLSTLHSDMLKLQQKYKRYLAWSDERLDRQSWPLDTHCDGLLFSSLYAVAGGKSLVGLAEDPWLPGRYFRHWQQNCYINYLNGQSEMASKSTISRDMLTGLAHWLWSQQDLKRLQDLINFGEKHSLQQLPLVWVIGEGQAGRTEMSPALMQTLYQMRERLSGEKPPPTMQAWNFQTWGPCEGYHCHLMALHILLRWRIHGEIDELAQERLGWLVHREPHNALYATIYGLISGTGQAWPQALETLLNPRWFPEDRLPSSRERCSFYIFERDYLKSNGQVNKDWLACPEQDKTFSGIDFIFASALLLEGYESLTTNSLAAGL